MKLKKFPKDNNKYLGGMTKEHFVGVQPFRNALLLLKRHFRQMFPET